MVQDARPRILPRKVLGFLTLNVLLVFAANAATITRNINLADSYSFAVSGQVLVDDVTLPPFTFGDFWTGSLTIRQVPGQPATLDTVQFSFTTTHVLGPHDVDLGGIPFGGSGFVTLNPNLTHDVFYQTNSLVHPTNPPDPPHYDVWWLSADIRPGGSYDVALGAYHTPEPATLWLGAAGLLFVAIRKKLG